MKIPFLSLYDINNQYHDEIKKEVTRFLDSGHYILGSRVDEFEENFANYCQSKYCVGVANGLDALILILESFNFNKNAEVIVPANTYIASIIAIKRAGLKPVLVEPNPQDFLIEPDNIISVITPNTAAILAVNLYGKLCDFEKISEIRHRYNLKLVVDAAQSHGASKKQSKVCKGADAVAYSFYPSKNLGAMADAGAIITDDHEIFASVKSKRNYGSAQKYVFDQLGINSRLSEIQAAILNIKLKYLDQETSKRRILANRYFEKINNLAIKLPAADSIFEDAWHLFVIRINNRKKLIELLSKSDIGYEIHYPIAPHKQKAMKEYENLKLPITENIHETVLSIPLNASLNIEQIDYIATVLNTYTD